MLYSIGAFAIFCALSGVVYLVNDVMDRDADRNHPTKRLRPIASGALPVSVALTAAFVLGAGALGAAYWLRPAFAAIGAVYLALLASYSGPLKHIVIIDVLTIAIGFVLAGGRGGGRDRRADQPRLLFLTILLALFLALSKRRHELVLLADGATTHRRILQEYSPYLLDQMIAVVTASTIVAYAFYTVSPEIVEKFHTNLLGLTLPFPLYGIFRYLYLVHQKEGGGSPAEMLLTDRPLLVCVALWALVGRVHHLRARPCRSGTDQLDMPKSKVAILRTTPATVLRDYHSVMNLAGYQDVLAKDADTALKVNISWHFFFPATSTTPWQLEGVIRALKQDGYSRDLIHACHNRTVVIDAHLGERENKQINVVAGARPAQHPHLRDRGVDQHPRRGRRSHEEVHVPERGLPEGLHDSEALHRREHHSPADGEDARVHDDDRRDEERVRRAAERAPALDAPGDPRDARGPADDPEEDSPRRVRGDGRHVRRRRAGPALHDAVREERDPRQRRPGRDRRRGGEADGLRSDVDQVHPDGARPRARLRRPARDRDRRRRVGRRRRTGTSWGRSRR